MDWENLLFAGVPVVVLVFVALQIRQAWNDYWWSKGFFIFLFMCVAVAGILFFINREKVRDKFAERHDAILIENQR